MDESLIATESFGVSTETDILLLQEIASNTAQSVELQGHIYSAMLLVIGVIAAIGVCVTLYKFLRLFY